MDVLYRNIPSLHVIVKFEKEPYLFLHNILDKDYLYSENLHGLVNVSYVLNDYVITLKDLYHFRHTRGFSLVLNECKLSVSLENACILMKNGVLVYVCVLWGNHLYSTKNTGIYINISCETE